MEKFIDEILESDYGAVLKSLKDCKCEPLKVFYNQIQHYNDGPMKAKRFGSLKASNRKYICEDVINFKGEEVHVSKILQLAKNQKMMSINLLRINSENEILTSANLKMKVKDNLEVASSKDFAQKNLKGSFHIKNDYVKADYQIEIENGKITKCEHSYKTLDLV